MTAEDTSRETASARTRARPPLWRDIRAVRVALQVGMVLAVAGALWYLGTNLVANMGAQGMRTDFGFLGRPAGFTLGAGTEFSSRDSIFLALLAGLRNTIYVSVWGIVLASVVGLIVGVGRLSSNWLVRKSAAVYVEALRNIPLILFLFFVYFAVLTQLPPISEAVRPLGLFVMSNRGLHLPWFETVAAPGGLLVGIAVGAVLGIALGWRRTRRFEQTGQPHHRWLWGGGVLVAVSVAAWVATGGPVVPSMPVLNERIVDGGLELAVEYSALLIGLVLYMSAFLAEVIRGSIQAVSRGQSEAADAVGLSGLQRLRFVILPQAYRVAVPPTGNEYINLMKNSALGLSIAFPELLRVTRIAVGQGNPAPQLFFVMMLFYLGISLAISIGINLYNRRLRMRGGT